MYARDCRFFSYLYLVVSVVMIAHGLHWLPLEQSLAQLLNIFGTICYFLAISHALIFSFNHIITLFTVKFLLYTGKTWLPPIQESFAHAVCTLAHYHGVSRPATITRLLSISSRVMLFMGLYYDRWTLYVFPYVIIIVIYNITIFLSRITLLDLARALTPTTIEEFDPYADPFDKEDSDG
jgi:hypothetical protein